MLNVTKSKCIKLPPFFYSDLENMDYRNDYNMQDDNSPLVNVEVSLDHIVEEKETPASTPTSITKKEKKCICKVCGKTYAHRKSFQNHMGLHFIVCAIIRPI